MPPSDSPTTIPTSDSQQKQPDSSEQAQPTEKAASANPDGICELLTVRQCALLCEALEKAGYCDEELFELLTKYLLTMSDATCSGGFPEAVPYLRILQIL